jgi:para-nitrobenzyl esterase
MKKMLLTMGFGLLCSWASAQSINLFPVQTAIQHGVIEGNYDTKTGVQKYFGIPFAKPPVGE